MLTQHLEQYKGLTINADYNKIKNFKNQEVLALVEEGEKPRWELVHTKKTFGKNISTRNIDEVVEGVMDKLKALKLC